MNEFTYPDNCKGCPRLSVVEQHFNGHSAELQKVPIPTTEDLEELRFFAVEALRMMGYESSVAQKGADSMLNDIRFGNMVERDALEGHLQGVQEEADKLASGCPGMLKMKAVDGLGDTYRVDICRSPDIEPGRDLDAAWVERT